MLPELPHTSAVELQLTLLYQRLELLDGLIGHLEAYQAAPEMAGYSLEVDPPVLESASFEPLPSEPGVWQILTPITHQP